MIMETVRRTTRTDCGHGCVIRRAGEERASAPIRALVAVFVALLAVHFMPGTAYADSVNAEIISGPSVVPFADLYGASIAAPDRYTAAALLMGYGPDAISGWDDNVKAKLSNSGTGGNFYTFATNSVQNYFDITEHTGIFQQFFDIVGGTFWNTAQTLYGNNLWAALYTPDELAAAKADLELVLAGDDIGGGGSSGGNDEEFFVYDFTPKPNYSAWAGISKLYVPKNFFSFTGDASALVNNIGSGAIGLYSASGGKLRFDTIFFSSNDNPQFSVDNSMFATITIDSGQYVNMNSSVTCDSEIKDGALYLKNVSLKVDVNRLRTTSVPITREFKYDGTIGSGVFGGSYGGGGSGEPVIPPTNWPEPESPEPPDLPEPGDPVVEPPEPYEPSNGPTYIWNITNTSEPTDTSDLLEWIKKIFYELKAIHSDLKTWFENLGDAISDGFDAMDNACEQIYDAVNENTDELRNQFQSLKTYLKQLFQWLKDQLNFQNDTFNDNNIVYWLKRIWSKLGNGDVNVRPTDPTTDPTGVWDWLIKLIQNFLIGLASSANDLISEMADLVSQVMHQFPFSIPWDIAAFLSAFAAAPITPDVDVTIPAIEGWWGETVISIDLSPYDTAAAAVRAMEKILFAAFLAWKSKDLLDFMDVTKWFNG